MGTGPVRVLCVEDNKLVADAMKRKLDPADGFEWVGWASNVDELIAAAARTPPDVVCMDLDIPGQDTFAMIRRLGQAAPSARVLVLSGHVRTDYIDRALDAGAWGYLSKGEDSAVIVDAIRRVAAGEFVLGKLTQVEYRRAGRQVPRAPARVEPPGR